MEAFIHSLLYSPSAFTSFSHCVHKCCLLASSLCCRLTEIDHMIQDFELGGGKRMVAG